MTYEQPVTVELSPVSKFCDVHIDNRQNKMLKIGKNFVVKSTS